MANLPADSLIELEDAVATFSSERCDRILTGLTGLLAAGRDRPDDMLARLVDGILLRLTERVEPEALVELSQTLAELTVAPQQTLRRLASHDDPEIACPILLASPALSATDLASIAASSAERQRRAICARSSIACAVTEALIAGADRTLIHALIKNPGTEFSDAAYAALISAAGQDDDIVKALALRPGTPDAVVRKLLAVPGGKVSAAKPNASGAPPSAPTAVALPAPAAYAAARPEIIALNRGGKLSDSTVNRFAIRGETANLITALSVLSGAPIEVIEYMITDDDCEGLVMACRASRLNWATTLAILSNRGGRRLSFAQRERAQSIFEALLLSTSQWTVRWGEMASRAGSADPAQRRARMEA